MPRGEQRPGKVRPDFTGIKRGHIAPTGRNREIIRDRQVKDLITNGYTKIIRPKKKKYGTYDSSKGIDI